MMIWDLVLKGLGIPLSDDTVILDADQFAKLQATEASYRISDRDTFSYSSTLDKGPHQDGIITYGEIKNECETLQKLRNKLLSGEGPFYTLWQFCPVEES